MREFSVAEQRYQAVLAVISDGLSVSQVAEKVGVSRQTLHSWLARYEAQGLEAGESVASAGVVSASNAGGGGSCAVGVAPVAAVCLVSRVATRCRGPAHARSFEVCLQFLPRVLRQHEFRRSKAQGRAGKTP